MTAKRRPAVPLWCLGAILALAIAFCLAAGAALAANPGNPATLDTQATVEVLEPISITETRAMTFGKIVGPIGASASNSYDTFGNVGGTGGGSYVSGAVSGGFSVSGSNEPTFLSAGATGACSDAKVVLTNPDIADAPLSTASFTLGLSGRIVITNAADGTGPLGVVTCPYAVSVRYQ